MYVSHHQGQEPLKSVRELVNRYGHEREHPESFADFPGSARHQSAWFIGYEIMS
jgi:hypothetical protein